MHKNRDVKGIKGALIASTVIGMLMAGEFAFATVTPITMDVVNDNPGSTNFVREKLSEKNIRSEKVMGFNVGNDLANPKVGDTRLERIAKTLEREKGFDSFSVNLYTLKNGNKVGGISVLAKRGRYDEFYQTMKGLLLSKADYDKCRINRFDIEESDNLEVYTIFFDYEEKALDAITPKTENLVDDNPGAVKFIIEKLAAKKIRSTKVMDFDTGKDIHNSKTGRTRIERLGLVLETLGFDTFSVTVSTLKNGKKVGGVSVLSSKGRYEEFYRLNKSLLKEKADYDKCAVNRSDLEGVDGMEVYSIWFDYEEGRFFTVTPVAKTENLVNNNPGAITFINEKLNEKNISSTKVMEFDFGDDQKNDKTGRSRRERIGIAFERRDFDTFCVVEHTLKNGKKVAGISVLAKKGRYDEFYKFMKRALKEKADYDKCAINRSAFEGSDEMEVYSIWFDYEE